jgi:hypothetical protein
VFPERASLVLVMAVSGHYKPGVQVVRFLLGSHLT